MKKFNFNIKDRKMLFGILCIVFVCVFTLTIVYAALNAVLTISGNAEVAASNWDIYLANPKVTNGSATMNVPEIKSNSTLEFSATLDMPGDFYEFTVDVVNDGSIDAMIENVVKTPELDDSQKKYLKYEITYQNGESIDKEQLLASKTTMPIKVRLEYRTDLSASDLPTGQVELELALTLEYVQSDGTGSSVTNNGSNILVTSYYSSMSTAFTAINDDNINGSSDATLDTAAVGVYGDSNGELTVKLFSDVSLTEILEIGSNLTLDLNGHTISTTVTPAIRITGMEVFIDGSVEGSGITVNAPAGQKGTVLSVMDGSLSVNGGNYTANTSGAGTSTNQSQCLYAYNSTSLHVTNANITSIDVNNGSVNGVTGKTGSSIVLENTKVYVESGISLENRGVSSEGNVTLKNCDIRAVADYVANAAGTNYASNSRGVWCKGHLIMENCYVDASHAGVTVLGTVYVNGGKYNGYGHGGIYLGGTAGPHYFYNAEFNWAPMQDGSVSDVVAGTNGAAFYIGGASNQTAYFDNCKFNMVDANGETYKGAELPFYGIVLRTSGGEKNNYVYISNSYVKAAKNQMFRGVGSSGHKVYNGAGNDWSAANKVHTTSTTYFVDTGASYAAS